MTSLASRIAFVELDERTNNGITVSLLLGPDRQPLLRVLDASKLEGNFTIPIANPEDASYAFIHPFAYAEERRIIAKVNAR